MPSRFRSHHSMFKKYSVDIIHNNPKYLVINKGSGLNSKGYSGFKDHLMPQVFHLYKHKIDSQYNVNHLKLVQRLDKFVTGGMVIGKTKDFVKNFNKTLSKCFVRKYVGLLSVPNSVDLHKHLNDVGYNTSGTITTDIERLPKNYSAKTTSTSTSTSTPPKLHNYPSVTQYKILMDCYRLPSAAQIQKYPDLYNNITLYPIIFKLETGRKNQIRDHCLTAFKFPLLNDDNFPQFKLNQSANSTKYPTNQIGLHSAYLEIIYKGHQDHHHSFTIPILQPDRELWQGFLTSSGHFNGKILHHLTNNI